MTTNLELASRLMVSSSSGRKSKKEAATHDPDGKKGGQLGPQNARDVGLLKEREIEAICRGISHVEMPSCSQDRGPLIKITTRYPTPSPIQSTPRAFVMKHINNDAAGLAGALISLR